MVVLGMSMMGRSVPTDGYFDHPGNSQKTGDAYRWLNGVVAGDGGTMVVGGVYGSPVHTMNFNQGGVLLGNLLFVHEGIISVMGDPITMSGDAPVVKMRNPSDKNNSVFNRRAGYFDAQLSGTGSNTLVKDGGGKWIMKQPITGFAEVYVKDGGLVATNNDSAAAVTDCPLRLSGYLGYQSSHLSSDTGADWAASGAANGLTVEAGAQISINKVNANSAALTVGQISKTTNGSLLVRSSRGTSSARALGVTEKLLTAGTVPRSSSGVVAPWMAAREVAEPGTPVHFLKYDAESGFMPFSDALSSFGSATKDDLVKVSASTTLDTAASAAAVEVDNANQLVVDTTLSLGDGTNPGAIALNSTGTGAQTFSGTGVVDFGDKPGYIWRGASGGVLTLAAKFRGSQGVTISSGGTADGGSESPDTHYNVPAPTFMLNNNIFDEVSGGIYIANCAIQFYKGAFGANDVHVEGGNRWGGAIMRSWDYGPITNRFYLRGDTCLDIPAAKASDAWTFDAPVTLTGDASFSTWNQAMYFKKPIDGSGDLELKSSNGMSQNCHIRFDAANTYDGRTTLGSGTELLLTASGTFGAGDVAGSATSKVTFEGQAGYTLTQNFENDGTTELRSSAHIDFLGKTSSGTTIVSESELGVGGDVSLGAAYLGSVAVRPASPSSVLTIAGGSSVSATFQDAAGKTLDIVKTGEGTATFCRPLAGASTARGTLRIDEGVVRLERNPLLSPACSFWIDFSDGSTITAQAGVENGIGSVASKGVLPYKFKYSNPTGASACTPLRSTATINGLAAAHLHYPDATKTWFSKTDGDYRVGVRTLFIVHRPDSGGMADNASLFGSTTSSVGIRARVNDGIASWQCKIGGSDWTSGYMYTNGVLGAGFTPGETQVLAIRVPANVTVNTSFVPRLTIYSGTSISYKGDIAEVIGFDGALTDDEFDFVNAYLAEKWLGAAHRDVSISGSQYLPENADVVLAGDGTIDLNGVSQTIASLTGKGKVVNTSGVPATLTVTGEFDGSILIGEGVTLAQRGATTMRVYNDGPVTNGLAYWLDASKAGTIITNEHGEVTEWLSRAGSVASMLNDGTATMTTPARKEISSPVYVDADEGGFNGRPVVRFDRDSDGLWASDGSLARTVFIVRYDSTATWTVGGNPAIWGVRDGERHLFFSRANNPNSSLSILNGHSQAYGQYDDRMRITKADGYVEPAEFGNGFTVGGFVGVPYVISLRIDASNPSWNMQVDTALGATGWRFGRWQTVGEVIVYERTLSDGEMESVENYLVSKWITSPSLPSENDAVVLSGTITIPVRNDGTVQPIAVEGPLDASAANLRVTNARQAPKYLAQDLVTATEVKSGFASVAADWEGYKIWLKNGSDYVGKPMSGFSIFVR